MLFNDIYIDSTKIREFWTELNVNYDSINEKLEAKKKEDMNLLLNKLTIESLKDIANIYGIKDEKSKKSEYISAIMKICDENLLLIEQFTKRKKKSINEFYNYWIRQIEDSYTSSSIVKLLHIYNISRCDLFQIMTLEEWNLKGSGYELEATSKVKSWNILDNLTINNDARIEFVDYLFEKSDQDRLYKVRSYCKNNSNSVVLMLYKLANDLPKVDFDQSKRFKEVEKILIKVNTLNDSIHIKCKNKKDMIYIKSYFENKLEIKFEVSEGGVFSDYDEKSFKENFFTTERMYLPKLKGFQIDKIIFSESLLSKAPEFTISLPKRNIWPSVVDAVCKNLVNIDSLSTIKYINLNFNNISRPVRSYTLEDDSIIFRLLDSGLDENTKKSISEKFEIFFGIPLNKRIIDKLDKGIAHSVDFILRVNNKDKINEYSYKVFEQLCKDKIIESKNVIKYLCSNENCREEIVGNIKDFNTCKICEDDKYIEEKISEVVISEKNIHKSVINLISSGLDIETNNIKLVHQTINNKKLNMCIFNYNSKEYQVLIVNNTLSKKTVKELEKRIIPTMIVYYGIERNVAQEMTPSTMEGIQFGELYINKDNKGKLNDIFKAIIDSLDNRVHYQIVSGATTANDNLKRIIIDGNKDKEEYSYNDLEDDAYAILKDIFFNSDKWGRENIGSPVPEGIFAMSYKTTGNVEVEKRHAFSYDCKLTAKDKGYDLGKSEQRKAEDYVEELNNLKQIRSYCSNKCISAHIFIGNKFKSTQIEGMKAHFNNKLSDTCNTIPMFIEIENLLKLHDWYRLNYEKIKSNVNPFYEELFDAMTNDSSIITSDILDEIFENISEYFGGRELNTSKIKALLTK